MKYSVCIFHRETGSLAHVISFQGGLFINQIITGLDNYTLISHSSYSDTAFSTSLSVYKLTHRSTNPHRFSELDVNVDLQYKVANHTVSKFSLSKCRRKFVTTESSESHRLTVLNFQDSQEVVETIVVPLPTTPPDSWSKAEFGYLSETSIFTLWRHMTGSHHTLVMMDRGVVTMVDLTPWNLDMKPLDLATNGRDLLALTGQGVVGVGIKGYEELGDWAIKDGLAIFADPSTLVASYKDMEQHGLVILDFI